MPAIRLVWFRRMGIEGHAHAAPRVFACPTMFRVTQRTFSFLGLVTLIVPSAMR